jgi:hypothetical protein
LELDNLMRAAAELASDPYEDHFRLELGLSQHGLDASGWARYGWARA